MVDKNKIRVKKHLVLGAGTGLHVQERWDNYFQSDSDMNIQTDWYTLDKRCKRRHPTSKDDIVEWDKTFVGDFNHSEVWNNIKVFVDVAGKFDSVRFDISTAKFADLNLLFFHRVLKVLKDDGVLYLPHGNINGALVLFKDAEIQEYRDHIEYCAYMGEFITRYAKYIGDPEHLLFQDEIDELNGAALSKYFETVSLMRRDKSIIPLHPVYGGITDYYILRPK